MPKELLISIADRREIEYTLVPNTKGKSDLWKHLYVCKRKTDGRIDPYVAVCKQCNSVVRLSEDTSNMSTLVQRHHPLLLLGSPVGNKRKADTLIRISRYTGILHRYGHEIPVPISVPFILWYHTAKSDISNEEYFIHIKKHYSFTIFFS